MPTHLSLALSPLQNCEPQQTNSNMCVTYPTPNIFIHSVLLCQLLVAAVTQLPLLYIYETESVHACSSSHAMDEPAISVISTTGMVWWPRGGCILLVNLLHLMPGYIALSRDLGTSCASIDQFVDCVCVDMTWEVVLVMIQGARSLTTAHQETPPQRAHK